MISVKSKKLLAQMPLHLMLLPGIVLLIIFSYIPMFGLIMAFQNFNPFKGFLGSEFVYFENFIFVFTEIPTIWLVIRNTVVIALGKILLGFIVPVIVVLLINEIRNKFFKGFVQTLIYLPHFLSWVILGGLMKEILATNGGLLNNFLNIFGIQNINFLTDSSNFQWTLILTETWKEFGYGTVVYLAALTGIDATLYEAAEIDGANRWKQTWHITMPGLIPMMALMGTLSLGNVLNAGFDQVFNLYSPLVYDTGDILDTLIYRIGLKSGVAGYSRGAAVGLIKSIVSTIFIVTSYKLAKKYAGYKIF